MKKTLVCMVFVALSNIILCFQGGFLGNPDQLTNNDDTLDAEGQWPMENFGIFKRESPLDDTGEYDINSIFPGATFDVNSLPRENLGSNLFRFKRDGLFSYTGGSYGFNAPFSHSTNEASADSLGSSAFGLGNLKPSGSSIFPFDKFNKRNLDGARSGSLDSTWTNSRVPSTINRPTGTTNNAPRDGVRTSLDTGRRISSDASRGTGSGLTSPGGNRWSSSNTGNSLLSNNRPSSNSNRNNNRGSGNNRRNNEGSSGGRGGAMFPGTKWCGSGNKAENDTDVGEHEETDKCCREHDNCPDYIEAGETKHGLTNDGYYTRLSCKCDQEFHRCLKRDNSRPSQNVGNTYFNLLTSRCFKSDYPIVKCVKEEPGKIWTRCEQYEQDRSKQKEYQFFDNPAF